MNLTEQSQRFLIIAGLAIMAALFTVAATGIASAVVVPKADLAVRMASNDLTPDVGQQVILRTEVRNYGPDAADLTALTIHIAGYTFDSFCTPSYLPHSATLICTPSALPAGWMCATTNPDEIVCATAGVPVGKRTVIGVLATRVIVPDGVRPAAEVGSTTKDPVLSNNTAVAQSTLP